MGKMVDGVLNFSVKLIFVYGRSDKDNYHGPVLFLGRSASRYMTGALHGQVEGKVIGAKSQTIIYGKKILSSRLFNTKGHWHFASHLSRL
jgi:hypothetical protein